MARIEIRCTRCKAQLVTEDVTEALEWDKGHDARCPARPRPPRRRPSSKPAAP